jgi:UDP-N-acetylglucosamine 3-dehydrogenase
VAEPLTHPGTGGLVFLGCGGAAAMHSRTLARAAPGLPRSYASRDVERARSFAERHGGAHAFGSYEHALASDDVTIAMVVTPPSSHLEWALAALEAGKHVIVEKPAFLDSAEFDAVMLAAERADRQVLVAENYAYKPLARELRWLLAEEPLGRVLFLNVNAVKHQSAGGWREDPSLSGGGALFEGGIHWVSLLAHLGPEVTRVRAASPAHPGEAERSIQLLLRYEQGTVASLCYSWQVPSPLKGLRISRAYATDGSVLFESNGLFFVAVGRRWRLRATSNDVLGYRAMFLDLLEALRSGAAPRYTVADARRDVEIVAEAYRDAGLAPDDSDAGGAGMPETDSRDREGGRT